MLFLILFKLFLFNLFYCSNSLESTPYVECQEDAMRLHFTPDNQSNGIVGNSTVPFCGHIYIKGFFFSTRCHLDLTRVVDKPFFFHIPYRSDCQVRRERIQNQTIGENQRAYEGAGFLYSVIVIVQHHQLFITERDKAYKVSCFYRDERNVFQNSIQIGDLTPNQIDGTASLPSCSYEILSASTNLPIHFANVGEQLIHRWACDSDGMGMLVHSCFVRDGIGSEFPLLDKRGCPTDDTLMKPITYSPLLNESYTPPLAAFKFAEQMIVYFKCQITLCRKRDNGCEGISPPVCNETNRTESISSLGMEQIQSLQLISGRNGIFGSSRLNQVDNNSIIPRSNYADYFALPNYETKISNQNVLYTPYNIQNNIQPTTMPSSTTKSLDLKNEPISNVKNEWEPEPINLFSRGRNHHVRQLRDVSYFAHTVSTWHDFPSNQSVGLGQVHPEKVNAFEKNTTPSKKNLTIDVAADRLIIFTNDEKLGANNIIKQDAKSFFSKAEDASDKNDSTLFWIIGLFVFIIVIFTFVLFIIYQRRQIVRLQKQLQYNYQRQQPSLMATVLPKFEPMPFFELASLPHNTSRQNLVM